MSKEPKNFKLLKDLPNVNAEAILKLSKRGTCYTCNDKIGHTASFSIALVENNPLWFEPVPDTPPVELKVRDIKSDGTVQAEYNLRTGEKLNTPPEGSKDCGKLESGDVERINALLDGYNIPIKAENGLYYSLWGRIMQFSIEKEQCCELLKGSYDFDICTISKIESLTETLEMEHSKKSIIPLVSFPDYEYTNKKEETK